jgi:hypothetical protein
MWNSRLGCSTSENIFMSNHWAGAAARPVIAQ